MTIFRKILTVLFFLLCVIFPLIFFASYGWIGDVIGAKLTGKYFSLFLSVVLKTWYVIILLVGLLAFRHRIDLLMRFARLRKKAPLALFILYATLAACLAGVYSLIGYAVFLRLKV